MHRLLCGTGWVMVGVCHTVMCRSSTTAGGTSHGIWFGSMTKALYIMNMYRMGCRTYYQDYRTALAMPKGMRGSCQCVFHAPRCTSAHIVTRQDWACALSRGRRARPRAVRRVWCKGTWQKRRVAVGLGPEEQIAPSPGVDDNERRLPVLLHSADRETGVKLSARGWGGLSWWRTGDSGWLAGC